MGDKELATRISGDFKQAKSDKDNDMNRCRRYERIYQALDQINRKVDESSGKLTDDRRIYSNTYLPYGAAVVDTGVSSVWNAFFGSPDYFEIDAANPYDELFATKITAHLKKRHKEMKFKTVVYRALQQAACFDYSVTCTKWRVEGGYIPKRVPIEDVVDLGGVKLKERRIEIQDEWVPNAIDRSHVELFDYFNCYHDTKAKTGLEDSEFFIDVRQELIENLIAESQNEENPFGRYKNIRAVINEMAEELNNVISQPIVDEDQLTMIMRRRVTIVRYWTKHHVAEMIGNNIVSRQNINGWPLQLWRFHVLPNKFRGMGLVQRIERGQYDINAIINLKRDHQNLVLNPIAVVDEELVDLNEGKVQLYPGRTLVSSGGVPGDKVYFYNPGVIPQGALEEINIQVQVMNEVTGLGPNQKSQFSSGRTTAREVAAVQAGALSKIMTVALNMEEECLEPIYQQLFLLEQRFMRGKDVFKYHGDLAHEWIRVTPTDYKFMAMPSFMAKGTSIIKDRDIEITQFLAAMDRAVQIPQFNNMKEVSKKMWQLLQPNDWYKFIIDGVPNQPNIPPQMENRVFAEGKSVEVSPANDDAEHLQVHKAHTYTPDYQLWPQAYKNRFEQHMANHQMADQEKQVKANPNLPNQQDASDQDRGIRGGSQLSIGAA